MIFRSGFFCGLSLFLVAISGHASGDLNTDVCNQLNCMIVVDAGSTGSRIHLYAYERDSQLNPVHINELYTKKINPGFATIEPKAEAVNQYLNQLFANTPANDLPVYFYATAGMRLIPNSQQQELYRFLKQWFWTEQRWKLQEARTIGGAEEGVLGWLGINYHLNTLQSSNQSLVGLVEIGGASVQLVFPIDDLTNIEKQDIVRVTAYGQQFLIYAHSFLGAGVNETIKQIPTFPACYPLDYPLSNGEFATGSASSCEQMINQTINLDNIISNNVKTAAKNNPPSLWYTVGAASYLVQQSSDYFKNTGLTPQTLLNYVDAMYCQKNWSVLQELYPNDPFKQQNCISGSLFYSLTVDSFGLSPDQAVHTLTDGTNADWTLGVVIRQSST